MKTPYFLRFHFAGTAGQKHPSNVKYGQGPSLLVDFGEIPLPPPYNWHGPNFFDKCMHIQYN